MAKVTPLTRFETLVQDRVRRDTEFAAALLEESLQSLLDGDVDTGVSLKVTGVPVASGARKQAVGQPRVSYVVPTAVSSRRRPLASSSRRKPSPSSSRRKAGSSSGSQRKR